jgi:hypothetical protein
MDNISSKYAKATYSTVVFIIVVLIFWGWRSGAAKNTIVAANTTKDAQANNIGAVKTWNCGDSGGNVIATMIDAKTLTISGTGKMYDYHRDTLWSGKMAPWYDIKDSITDVIIEHDVTSIGNYAFEDFKNLTSVTIPNSVKNIGDAAFVRCSSITSITIPNSVTYIGREAFAISGLTSVVIPDSITYIQSGVFAYCENLTNITLHSSVRVILEDAFAGCTSLTSITIPKSVHSIGTYAFDGCVNLMSIIINNPQPPSVDDHLGTFGDFFEPDMTTFNAKRKLYFSKACIYVPSNSIAAYRADKGWNDFKCIKPIESAPIGGK